MKSNASSYTIHSIGENVLFAQLEKWLAVFLLRNQLADRREKLRVKVVRKGSNFISHRPNFSLNGTLRFITSAWQVYMICGWHFENPMVRSADGT